MTSSVIGAGLAMTAGTAVGLSIAPIKLMSQYKFEHWAFVHALVALVALPWGLAFALCPDLSDALHALPFAVYLKANLWSLAWGVANVLCGLCFVRIGMSLTMGILTGVGLPVGILLPMGVKGSGQFADAPALFSRVGLELMGLTLLLVVAVVWMAQAGYGRERVLGCGARTGGSFLVGLAMAVASGVLQAGLSFAFVYSQGPLTEALAVRGANGAGAVAAVWAVTLPGGAAVNALFPLWLMSRRRNGAVLLSVRDFCLCVVRAALFVGFLVCMGSGMRMMGALGASLGFGLYQGFQIVSARGVGIVAGEWHCVPRRIGCRMVAAVILLLAAVFAMAFLRVE